MADDRNFDELFERFQRNIKKSEKGWLREVLIREDLEGTVLAEASGPLRVLDLGCGLGDMSVWWAAQGHSVRASDLSAKMIEHGRQEAARLGLTVAFQQESAQASLLEARNYDVICMHAVMEWMSEPYSILPALAASLRPGGYLSLTVYNLHRSVFNSLVKGNLQKIKQGDFGNANPGSLTPPHPILPERVREGLEALGFTIELQAGLRCFYDYLSEKNKSEITDEDILLLERRYRKEVPYRDFARYVHFVARAPLES